MDYIQVVEGKLLYRIHRHCRARARRSTSVAVSLSSRNGLCYPCPTTRDHKPTMAPLGAFCCYRCTCRLHFSVTRYIYTTALIYTR